MILEEIMKTVGTRASTIVNNIKQWGCEVLDIS